MSTIEEKWSIIGYQKIYGWTCPFRAVLDCPKDEHGRYLVLTLPSHNLVSVERHFIDETKLLNEEQARQVPLKSTTLMTGEKAVWHFTQAISEQWIQDKLGDGNRRGEGREEW